MAHIPRLYRPGRLAPGPLLIDGEAAKRLTSVMRLRAGDRFLCFAGDGREWEATVAEVGKSALRVEVGPIARQAPPSPLVVELWAGLVRPNRFDWLIEKCTEAGVDILWPLLSEHAARGEGTGQQRAQRWGRIAVEAAEQSARLFLPVVEPPAAFDALLGRPHGPLIVADASGWPWDQTAALLPLEGRLAIAIGPEGGFSPAELAAARAHGAIVASLGPNVLRTETAAVVAVSLVRALRP
jgi:16S rRNA (uracil1498-N3)-methyltransferase